MEKATVLCTNCRTLNPGSPERCNRCGESLAEVGTPIGPILSPPPWLWDESTESATPSKSPTPSMDRAAFHEHMRSTFAKCLEISKEKNADYAGSEDPFANFRMVAHIGLCSVTEGILVRLSDKFIRIANLLSGEGRDPRVVDESVTDTIRDAINYFAILAAWLEEDGKTPKSSKEIVIDGSVLSEEIKESLGRWTGSPLFSGQPAIPNNSPSE